MTSGRCTVYGDLTMKYSNFTDDDNLVQFFAEVLARRDQLDLITSGSGGDTTDGANPAHMFRISRGLASCMTDPSLEYI